MEEEILDDHLERKGKPKFAKVSLVFGFFAMVGFAILIYFSVNGEIIRENNATDKIGMLAVGILVLSVLGLGFAFVSRYRKESVSIIRVIGFIINGGIAALFFAFIVFATYSFLSN